MSFIAELKQDVHRGFYCEFFNKWDVLVGSVSSCFMHACFFGRLKYKTRLPDSFSILKKHDFVLPNYKKKTLKDPFKVEETLLLTFGMKRENQNI